jgi:hypothetical protein
MLSENAFKEMPTLADKSSDFGFSSGIQVYFWTQRTASESAALPPVGKGAEMNGRNLWGHTLAPLMPEGEANAWDGLVQDMNGEAAR